MNESKKGGGIIRVRENNVLREIFYIFFLLFASFSNLWKSDCRISSKQEVKLIHAARGTRGYKILEFCQTP